MEIDSLVFEGGGVKGIAYIGGLQVLEEKGILKDIKKFAGSSAGAIIASLLALKYSISEIETILKKTSFNDFKDDSWGVFRDVYRLLNQYGYHPGDYFYDFIGDLVEAKTGNKESTLHEIYEQFGTEVVVTATCLNKSQTIYFHYKKYPDLPLRLVVRMSMSIPLFFSAVKWNGDIIIDGGVLQNYPIEIFDCGILEDRFNPDYIISPKVLGFKLIESTETKTYNIETVDKSINNIMDYTEALLNGMFLQIERGYIRKGYWKQTVCIESLGIKTTQFNLTNTEKELLIESGRNATLKYLH
jgi:NTE family protein